MCVFIPTNADPDEPGGHEDWLRFNPWRTTMRKLMPFSVVLALVVMKAHKESLVADTRDPCA